MLKLITVKCVIRYETTINYNNPYAYYYLYAIHAVTPVSMCLSPRSAWLPWYRPVRWDQTQLIPSAHPYTIPNNKRRQISSWLAKSFPRTYSYACFENKGIIWVSLLFCYKWKHGSLTFAWRRCRYSKHTQKDRYSSHLSRKSHSFYSIFLAQCHNI